MIRYQVAQRAYLEMLVDRHDATWRGKAAERTRALVQAGAYQERASIWSGIKLVFMAIQHYKCVFCERPLAQRVAGAIEQDVEHFRPKSSIKTWPRGGAGYHRGIAIGAAHPSGYYWLAYELENYAAACKPCNTIRKSNYFPVAGSRGAATNDIPTLNAQEMPLLIYPLGELDEDPESLITFEGILAVPTHQSGPDYDRARVTIDFFGLNDREELWEDRYRAIERIYLAMELLKTTADPAARSAAETALTDARSDAAPQASCARAFYALMSRKPTEAISMYRAARAFLRR